MHGTCLVTVGTWLEKFETGHFLGGKVLMILPYMLWEKSWHLINMIMKESYGFVCEHGDVSFPIVGLLLSQSFIITKQNSKLSTALLGYFWHTNIPPQLNVPFIITPQLNVLFNPVSALIVYSSDGYHVYSVYLISPVPKGSGQPSHLSIRTSLTN